MSDIVNLNRFRKDRKRTDEKKQAAVSRAQSGRTKAERENEAAEKKRRDELLDGRKLDP
jgi:hypothetical protein